MLLYESSDELQNNERRMSFYGPCKGCKGPPKDSVLGHMLRYDTIQEFNVDSKAEYSALASTRSQKKKLKQTTQCPFDTVQVKIREGSPEGIRVTGGKDL